MRRQLIVWDENGNPRVEISEVAPAYNKQGMARLYELEGTLPYVPQANPIDGSISEEEESLRGLPKAEVAVRKLWGRACAGDTDALKYIDDRRWGKPKQQVENVNVTVNYSDFLKQLANEDEVVITAIPMRDELEGI